MELLFWALALALFSSEVRGFSSILFGRKLLTKSLDIGSGISTIDTPAQYQYASSTSLRLVVDAGSVETDNSVGSEDTNDDEEGEEEEEEAEAEAETEAFKVDATIVELVDTEDLGNSTTLSPMEQAIIDYEKKLAKDISNAEVQLRSERAMLTKIKDKESESGKNGFFMVQAQVNEFQKRRDADQKKKVLKNKREFVEKMLPVVDAFRKAESKVPASTEQIEEKRRTSNENRAKTALFRFHPGDSVEVE